MRLEDFSDDDSLPPCSHKPDPDSNGTQRPAVEDLPDVDMCRSQVRDEQNLNNQGVIEEDPPTSLPVEESTDGFNFSTFEHGANSDHRSNPVLAEAPDKRLEAKEKLQSLCGTVKVGQEQGGWCQRHPWSVNIRDAQKRKPNHPDYDKGTLYVPNSAFEMQGKGAKSGALSPFQKQFWAIKKDNYDVVIFFKKGKFYELYDVDADIGHQQLGLNFTKGGRVDMRCCGVPEQAFAKHCSRLIELGYKVGRVEQTETANAAEKRKKKGGNASSVCERTLVRILTKGTVTDEGLLNDHRARYVLSLFAEKNSREDSVILSTNSDSSQSHLQQKFGICFVDVASGRINLGTIEDDSRMSRTERLLTILRPYEIIAEMSNISKDMQRVIKWFGRSEDTEVIDISKKDVPRMTGGWLKQYLTEQTSWEKAAEVGVLNHLNDCPLSASAFGAVAHHLRSLKIDKETLSLGNYSIIPSRSTSNEKHENTSSSDDENVMFGISKHLRMDASTLQNLEVLSPTDFHMNSGSLLNFVDRASTPAGRRLLGKWVAEPLIESAQINDRLEAIGDILKMEEEMGPRTIRDIVRKLRTKKDLERALPKLHRHATVGNAAVMFDDSNKRQVKGFVSVLRSLEDSLHALDMFLGTSESLSRPLKSKRLGWICRPGCAVPKVATEKLKFFLGDAFDLQSAEESGLILPAPGAVPHYDQCKGQLDEVEGQLNEELEQWKRVIGDRTMTFYHRGKEPYQMEVSRDALVGPVHSELQLVSESKRAKRFYTKRIRNLIKAHVTASEAFDLASESVARDMIRHFDTEYPIWACISSACAELDALFALAEVSKGDGSGSMCRPTILPDEYPNATFIAEELRHPVLASLSRSFVSNDVMLGDATHTNVMVLSGPNAGGKSTMARQIGLAVILAQLGCFVPAKSLTLRPFHDIYVRMGASDDLAKGRSTFMVEMEEMAYILNNANDRSLIIADEVGRGTSTHDGFAVASACLKHIATNNRALTVFSTHYNHLADELIARTAENQDMRVANFEMSAKVNEKEKRITFQYKLKPGQSGHSRGIYCARVAGISGQVADHAERESESFNRRIMSRLICREFQATMRKLDIEKRIA